MQSWKKQNAKSRAVMDNRDFKISVGQATIEATKKISSANAGIFLAPLNNRARKIPSKVNANRDNSLSVAAQYSPVNCD